MKGLTITKNIRCDFTPEQWGLFTFSKDCTDAAKVLNNTIETSYNEGLSYNETYDRTFRIMKTYREYGAFDSEPLYFMEQVLNEIYG